MTPLLCYDYLTEQVKLQQKCIKNIICKKSLIKQNIVNICHFRYKKETGPSLLSQRLLGLLLGTGKNGLVTISEVFAKVLIGPSFFQVSKVTNGQGFSLATVNRKPLPLLRVRAFLNAEYCSRLNKRYFGGKTR